jgi:hypothetical protein
MDVYREKWKENLSRNVEFVRKMERKVRRDRIINKNY